jgi:hypothetical protein
MVAGTPPRLAVLRGRAERTHSPRSRLGCPSTSVLVREPPVKSRRNESGRQPGPHPSASRVTAIGGQPTRRRRVTVLVLGATFGLPMALWWVSRPTTRAPSRTGVALDARSARSSQGAERATGATVSTTASTTAVDLAPQMRSKSALSNQVDQLAARVDSRQDDWDTETLSESALQQLSKLQSLLERGSVPEATSLELLVTPTCTSSPLRPVDLVDVYNDGLITVRRPAPDSAAVEFAQAGPAAFQQALASLVSALGPGDEAQVKFKLYRIARQTDYFDTQVRFEASRRAEREGREQTALWNCQWTYPSNEQTLPRLRQVTLERYEEALVTAPHGRLFVDCTQAALGQNAHYHQQVVPGLNHWLMRTPREFFGQFGHHGLAIGDVNGDGLDDLYVCDAGGLPNRLYIQQPDGTARDVAAEAGVDFLDDSTGVLLVDLDNDGDQDLVVGVDPAVQIAENDGRGRFRLRDGIEVNTDSFSISAADYDQDGDLDLYVCGYNVRKKDPTDRGLPFPVPYHDANNGGRNVLLRNDGNLTFTDVTRSTGMDHNNTRFSMAAAWEDVDDDGDVDLYVANDFGRNNLYRNDQGQFVDVAARSGVEDSASGMSVSWADYNRDGRMDVYVGNMFSSAGNRVTYQSKFSQGLADQTVSHLRHMARGNTLLENISRPGTIEFRDASEQQSVEMGRWAWASRFIDLTNDAWPDLVVANGYVTNANHEDL